MTLRPLLFVSDGHNGTEGDDTSSVRARLPARPAVLAGITLAILAWLAFTSASTLTLWRTNDKETAALESAVEDLSTAHELLQEAVYDVASYERTGGAQYAQRYDAEKPRMLGALERSQTDLEGNPEFQSTLSLITSESEALLRSLDVVREKHHRSRSYYAPQKTYSYTTNSPTDVVPTPEVDDLYSAEETASIRQPRDSLIALMSGLQNSVRDRFYSRRSEAADSLHRALITLFFSTAGALALGALILALLAWIARSHEQAEIGLAQSEDRYHDLLSHSSEMIAILAADGSYVYANHAWQERLGDHPEGRVALSLSRALPPPEGKKVSQLQARALRGEVLEDIPLRLTRPDGQPLLVQASLSLREGGEEGSAAVRWICRDITARDAHERRLRAQLAAGQVMAMAQSPQEALPQILEELGTAFGSDIADVWLVNEAQERLTRAYLWARRRSDLEMLRHVEPLERGDGLPGCVLDRGSGYWQNLQKSPPRFHAASDSDAPRLVNGWGVPVPFQGRILATLQFYALRPVFRDGELLATLEAIGVLLGQFLARCGQESQLDALHVQTDSILNSVAEGIVGVDVNGQCLFVNPAAADLLHIPDVAADGRGVHDLLHGNQTPEQACHSRCNVLRALQSGEGGSGEDKLFRPDGTAVPVEFTVSKLTHDGEVMGSVLTLRDVTARNALDRMKDEFVSTVSHELRTPLTSIRGALGLLNSGRMGELPKESNKLLGIAVTNTDRLIRLINDILDLERMESGRATLQIRAISMRDLLQQSLDLMRPMAEEGGVTLQFTPDGEAVAEVDPDRMLQVFTNLLSNAIKFSPAASRVSVQLEQGEHQVAVCIRDEGRGIPEEKLEAVFDRFHQVDASDSRQKGGTGLGLAICRTILEQHGGRIWAERNVGSGTTFRLMLPNTQTVEVPPKLIGDGGPVRTETVLICDDDPEARRSVRRFLEGHSLSVLEASDGAEAVRLTRQHLPGAVLLDTRLSDRNGWRVLNDLKHDPTTSSVPIVVLRMMLDGSAPRQTLGGRPRKMPLMSGLEQALHSGSDHATVLLVEDDEELAHIIRLSFERNGIRTAQARNMRDAISISSQIHPDLVVLDLNLPDGDGMELLRTHMEGMSLLVYSGRELSRQERETLRAGETPFLEKALVTPAEVTQIVMTLLKPAEKFSGMRREWDAETARF